MDLCRSYLPCGHEADSFALSLEDTFRGASAGDREKNVESGGHVLPTTRVLGCSPELPRRCSRTDPFSKLEKGTASFWLHHLTILITENATEPTEKGIGRA